MPTIPDILSDEPIKLPPRGSWPSSIHTFDDESHILAIRSALAAQRPLLVRGEPGAGKSQLARAAAEALGRLFLSEVVSAHSESQDLQWRYDAVGRLGDAQAMVGTGSNACNQLSHKKYLSPGVLWWVFNWETALQQHTDGNDQTSKPIPPKKWKPIKGSVLLIDEIDKADAELPNGLLETLGNGAFSVPWLDYPVTTQANTPTPLVMITTNEERELPAAFLRRCLVLNLHLPEKRQAFIDTLVRRGKMHFDTQCHEGVYQEAARQIWEDREALGAGVARPGQAEYIDMLRIVKELSENHAGQLAMLEKIAVFSLKKQPNTDE